MNDRLAAVLADLEAEGEQLYGWVAVLTDEQWATGTPARGWTIAHQIGHLTWTDEVSLRSVAGRAEWDEIIEAAQTHGLGLVDTGAAELAALAPASLLERWTAGRTALSGALAAVPDGVRLPWFGPPMSATSMATARLMETWAHAHDVAETLGQTPEPSARVRHVAHLGVRTRDFAYHVRGLTQPTDEFRVELTGPDGETWTWGPADAAQRVTGAAYDFALLATRRRHRDDVDVRADGERAAEWLGIVQAFAGPPGDDPRPRGAR